MLAAREQEVKERLKAAQEMIKEVLSILFIFFAFSYFFCSIHPLLFATLGTVKSHALSRDSVRTWKRLASPGPGRTPENGFCKLALKPARKQASEKAARAEESTRREESEAGANGYAGMNAELEEAQQEVGPRPPSVLSERAFQTQEDRPRPVKSEGSD